jgi:hypothetical protein
LPRDLNTAASNKSASQEHDVGKKTKQEMQTTPPNVSHPTPKNPVELFLFFLSAKHTNEMADDA